MYLQLKKYVHEIGVKSKPQYFNKKKGFRSIIIFFIFLYTELSSFFFLFFFFFFFGGGGGRGIGMSLQNSLE